MTEHADVCVILEGSYPYVSGGVSTWMHDLILSQPDLSFHVLALVADERPRQLKFELPKNVIGMSEIAVQGLPNGKAIAGNERKFIESLAEPLLNLTERSDTNAFVKLTELFAPHRAVLGRDVLLDSRAAFDLVINMYERSLPNASFLNYFWTWRALIGGLWACLLADLPKASTYHAISTGYAGLLAARAKIETGRSALLTEHGIYTVERQVEILMADWIESESAESLSPEGLARDLRDIWISTFDAYSRVCYTYVDEIITLYGGNQTLQLQGGASPEKVRLIPNGVDCARFGRLTRGKADAMHRPTVAFIGRVVPIKDVKTFLHAVGALKGHVPSVRAIIAGPIDEDPDYADECFALSAHLGLQDTVEFIGPIKLIDHMASFDVVVLTSVSEAQPLVVLEAGATGIPCVTTDVGACRELIYGRIDENPKLGVGGEVTRLAAPHETAEAIRRLLLDEDYRLSAGAALQARMRAHYDKPGVVSTYAELYARSIATSHAAIKINGAV